MTQMRAAAAVLAALALGVSLAAAKPTVDHAGELVDDFDLAGEQARFNKAAGEDGQLGQAEFAADAGKDGSFVRPYDSWDTAAAFDTDKSGALSWKEARTYRGTIRRTVLQMFDTDRDGKLTGSERKAANASLALGVARGEPAQAAPATRPAEGAAREGPQGRTRPRGQDSQWKKYDTDGDGALSQDERKAMTEAYRKRAGQREQAFVKKYDTDGDGKLSDAERRAGYAGQADEYRKKWRLNRYDKNKDGQLDEQETAAMEAEQAQWKARQEARRRKRILDRYDKNKDGTLDEQETAAREAEQDAWRKQREQAAARWKAREKQFDTDGDGQLSSEERSQMYKALRAEAVKKFDTDGDGKLSDEERRAMVRSYQNHSRRGGQSSEPGEGAE